MIDLFNRVFLVNRLPAFNSFVEKITPTSLAGDLREIYRFLIFFLISILALFIMGFVGVVLMLIWIGLFVMIYQIILMLTHATLAVKRLLAEKDKTMPMGILFAIVFLTAGFLITAYT